MDVKEKLLKMAWDLVLSEVGASCLTAESLNEPGSLNRLSRNLEIPAIAADRFRVARARSVSGVALRFSQILATSSCPCWPLPVTSSLNTPENFFKLRRATAVLSEAILTLSPGLYPKSYALLKGMPDQA